MTTVLEIEDVDFKNLSDGQIVILRKMVRWCELLSVVKNDYARKTTGEKLESLWLDFEKESCKQ
jgi:hypothetical protein